jgi:hypothetical protein
MGDTTYWLPGGFVRCSLMNIVGIGIFALGVVLLIFGFSASQSLSSEVSRAFTGNPTDRSMWLLVGGAVAVIPGLFLALRSGRRT